MSNVLATICDVKREHVARRKSECSEEKLHAALSFCLPTRGFRKALQAKPIGLIAEIKKASPSKGVIRQDFSPPDIAVAYETGGASCLSVLTDTPYFQGEDSYLASARNATALPVLRKDFIVDPYQVYESRVLGADCVLLIMAALEDRQAVELERIAVALKMDVLVEVHDEVELERALTHLSSPLIGVNNRNLKTLEVDLATTERLAKMIPDEKTIVCESGINTHLDIRRMMRIGVRCFLVGESLMRQRDIEKATRTLLGG
jgi:indole-3-glycerol phosphate synthase